MNTVFDYVIVGGGTAGCVLASRLSGYLPQSSILVIEAGVEEDPRVKASLGLVGQPAKEIKWVFPSAPQKAIGNKTTDFTQGKILGGTSSINHQVWSRGAYGDFERWAKEVGDERWSWEGLLPYFKKTETFIPGVHLQGRDLSELHGDSGPILVGHTIPDRMTYFESKTNQDAAQVSQVSSSGRPRQYPLKDAMANMYEDAGCQRAYDMNSGDILGYNEATTSSYDGLRQWAAGNYSFGPNVTVWTETHVTKVVVEGGLATGVEFLQPGNVKGQVSAREEVIVCSGAQGSPKLLLLSGIGPAQELKRHGIQQVADLPVGENYSDHPMLATYWNLESRGVSLGDVAMKSPQCDWTAGLPVDWMAFHRHDDDESIAFLAQSQLDPLELERFENKNRAHTESVILYGHIDFSGKAGPPPPGSNVCVMNILVTPSSRGTVTLQSTDPFDPPVCDPNVLSNETDKQLFFSVIRLTSEALERSIAPEHGLSESVIDESIRSDYSDDAIMQRCVNLARPVNHGSGTCAMGSVVDAECQVKGIEGLRVVDSSVIPLPLCGHYQAAVYAMAEQMAEIISI